MSNDLHSNSMSNNNNKVTNGTPSPMFNGVSGEALTGDGTNVSIIGTSNESLMNALGGAAVGQTVDPNVFMNPQSLMSYSPFASVDGGWTPTAYDPSLMAAFGFTGAGIMSGQALNPAYFFPGAAATDLSAAGIWGQENAGATTNPLMLGSFMMNPLSMDQQQQLPSSDMVAMGDGNIAAVNPIDPMIGLGQTFSALAMNGGVPGVMPPMVEQQQHQATVLPSNLDTPGGMVEEGAPQPTTPVSNLVGLNSAPQPEKPKSWAAIASQPAKPRPPPPPKPQPQPEVSSSESPVTTGRKSGGSGRGGGGGGGGNQGSRNQGTGNQSGSGKGSSGSRRTPNSVPASQGSSGGGNSKGSKSASQSELVGKLKSEKNPSELSINSTNARFFVIKSYAEDDIHRSIKYDIWTSTEHGNRRLDQAFREQKGKGGIYLFYSVNGSGHFCGVAQMVSEVDFATVTGVWAQDKWKGSFAVKWIYVKDVPNSQLRHIRLENNENKPVTNSRDTQEVPLAKARQVVKIIHSYQHKTSIFDDFDHYEKKQEEDKKQTT